MHGVLLSLSLYLVIPFLFTTLNYSRPLRYLNYDYIVWASVPEACLEIVYYSYDWYNFVRPESTYAGTTVVILLSKVSVYSEVKKTFKKELENK